MVMITRISLIVFTLFLAFLTNTSQAKRSFDSNSERLRSDITLKLAAKYPKNGLRDISSDGKLILFFQTNVPMRTFTWHSDAAPRVDNPGPYDDVLRVVDIDTSREVGRVTTNEFPDAAKFIPKTRRILYGDNGDDATKPGRLLRLWDVGKSTTKICLDTKEVQLNSDEIAFSVVTPLDSNKALGKISRRSGDDILVSVSLPDCTLTRIGSLSSLDPEIRRGGSVAYSPERQHIAFGTREELLVIRDTKTLAIVKEVRGPSGLILGEKPLFTADGRFLLIVASNTRIDQAETTRYLLFFDTTNYAVVRKLDITSWEPASRREGANHANHIGTAMAVLPDSRIMAVAYHKESGKLFSVTEEAEIVLYDLNTGNILTKQNHSKGPQKRNDPFASRIHTLMFSPDGKNLFSSTHDTIKWEIVNKN